MLSNYLCSLFSILSFFCMGQNIIQGLWGLDITMLKKPKTITSEWTKICMCLESDLEKQFNKWTVPLRH